MTRNIKLVIAYCGTVYLGWQKTTMGASIEAELEHALSTILQHHVQLQAASRTDAGVHAEGQVVNFFTQKTIALGKLKHSLNRMLPKDISVKTITSMPLEFHPTLDTVNKHYEYQICNQPVQSPFHRHTSWHVPYPLHTEQMIQGAESLLGTHDFSSFCNERKLWNRDPVCRLEKIQITPLPQKRLQILLIGDHFLFRMVRNLVGTLVYVGRGKLDARALPTILQKRDRTLSGVTAPAHGLVLTHVSYSNAMATQKQGCV